MNKKNEKGQTTLIAAIESSKAIVAESLIRDFGAEVNVLDGDHGESGDTALHLACRKASERFDKKTGKNARFGISDEK